MITSWQIYWITRLDGINVAFIVLAIVLFTICFGIVIIFSDMYGDNLGKYLKYIALCFVASLFCLLASVFVPSTKDMVTIYLLPKIVNNQDIQAIPADMAKIARVQLEKWIDGISKEEK